MAERQTASRERGMLLSPTMVLARLAGRKTQTRRPLTWRGVAPGLNLAATSLVATRVHEDAWRLTSRGPGTCWEDRTASTPCPHGIEGDRIWWREAFRLDASLDQLTAKQIAAKASEAGYRKPWAPIQYEADGARDNWVQCFDAAATTPGRYRHARFMPRWAARLVDEIAEVRAQRLVAITEEDAIAEGVERTITGDGWRRYDTPDMEAAGTPPCATARDSYRSLWELLHGPGSWTPTQWVWALTFPGVSGSA